MTGVISFRLLWAGLEAPGESYVRRRDFIKAIAGSAAAWPLAARAQQSGMPVVGFLGTRASGDDPQLLTAFARGLKEAGYVEGQNVAIEYRFAENQYDRLPSLAADLVRRKVALIYGNAGAVDPVEAGLVSSLNRPGGNITGVTILDVELGPKRLALLHELVPATSTV